MYNNYSYICYYTLLKTLILHYFWFYYVIAKICNVYDIFFDFMEFLHKLVKLGIHWSQKVILETNRDYSGSERIYYLPLRQDQSDQVFTLVLRHRVRILNK